MGNRNHSRFFKFGLLGDSKKNGPATSRRDRIGRASKVAKRIATASGYGCESLENRRLLTGTWTTVSNAIPAGDGAQNAMVLTDGTIMIHGGYDSSSNQWYKLSPVNGNYVSGNFNTLAASSLGRLFYGSKVLPSGNVMVIGGEYTGPSTTNTDTNTGEIYNPVSNSWTPMANFPLSSFGDDPTQMLPNGKVLTGYISAGNTYIYDPATNSWASTGSKLRGDRSDEESWVKLPDDSILSYDVFSSISTGTPHAQRYIPSTGTWVDAGNPPAQLSAPSVGYELGAGLLLPDGRVLYIGATGGRTAYYTPSSNSWAAGPATPGAYVGADAPAAVLPNGNVLMALSPEGGLNAKGNYTFPGPTKVYELNPSSGVYTDVTPSLGGFDLSGSTFSTTFLVLPSGQVMMFNDSAKIAVYTPSGGPNSAWLPSISNITNDSGSNVFTLSGYQLNGISEGAAYGDDNEMSSNYPIIQLKDQFGNISFARTFNWSATGVASVSSTVNFVEPGGLGAYLVTVIANGIASLPVLDIQCSPASGENFEIQPNANANYSDVNLIGAGVVATFYIGAFNKLIMTGDAASNTLVINDNLFGRSTVMNGGDGNDYLRVENNGTGTVSENGGNGDDYFDFNYYGRNLSNDTGFTYVYGGAGTNNIFVYDDGYTTATTYTVDSAEVNRPGFGGFYYDANVAGLTLTTGTGSDTTNIPSTYSATPFFLFAKAAMAVNIGSGGSVQGINASIYLDDSPSFMTINADDSADGSAHTVNMGSYTPSGDTPWGYISGLSPGNINYEYSDTSSISVATGTSTTNVVNILQTGVLTNLNGGGGSRTVNVGDGSQGVQGILGRLVLNASSGSETVILNDQSNVGGGTTSTLDNTVVNGYTSERITGLAPALIEYYLGGTTALTILSSSGGSNVTNVITLSNPLSIIGDSSQGSNDAVNLGVIGSNGILTGISGTVAVTNPPGLTDISVNDFSDTIAASYTFSSFLQAGTPWGKLEFPTGVIFGSLYLYSFLTFAKSDVSSLTVNAGKTATATVQDTTAPTTINEQFNATLTAYVQATTANLTINTTADNWTVNVGNAGSVQGINGPILITSTGFGSSGALVVNDSADAVSKTVVVSDSQISGLAPATISYPQYRTQYTISGGSGGNNFTIPTTPVGGLFPTNVLNTGDGNNTVIVDATQASFTSGALIVNGGNGNDSFTVGAGSLSTFNSPVTINGGAGTDTLLLADQSVAASDTYTITSTTVSRPNFNLTYSGLEALDLEAETGNNIIDVNSTAVGTPVAINANAGTDTINVNQTDPSAPVTIKPSSGNDAVNVDTTGSPGATTIFAASQQIGVLTIGNNGLAIVSAGPRILLQVDGVNTSGTGTLDLITNDMIVHSGSISSISSQIENGYNEVGGGNWSGNGITSSAAAGDATHLTALGSILNDDGSGHQIYGVGTTFGLFDGQNPGTADVLVKYTYFGDANLDGVVDGSDYTKIDNGFNVHLSGWANGDFNYDGLIDGSDYTLIDNAFNNQGVSLAAIIASERAGSTSPVTRVSGSVLGTGANAKGQSGWIVYADLNHDGKYDSGDIAVVTDASGHFTFGKLPIGNYWIRVKPRAGWSPVGATGHLLKAGVAASPLVFSERRVS